MHISIISDLNSGVSGELIRQDVTSGTKGVVTYLDINVIDVSTCKPVPNTFVELWGSNSTVSAIYKFIFMLFLDSNSFLTRTRACIPGL